MHRLHAAKLHILKQVRWSVLCYVCFTTIKGKKVRLDTHSVPGTRYSCGYGNIQTNKMWALS